MVEFGKSSFSFELPALKKWVEASVLTGAKILSGYVIEQQHEVSAPRVYLCKCDIFASTVAGKVSRFFSLIDSSKKVTPKKGCAVVHVCSLDVIGRSTKMHLIEHVPLPSE